MCGGGHDRILNNVIGLRTDEKVGGITYVDKCVFFTFAPPIIPLMDEPGHDLNSNVSQNMDTSLSFMLWMYME